MSFWGYRAYVPVAQRRANAVKEAAKLAKKGHALSPVVIEGRKIATSFWGKAWCDNLERYSDYANRLPRGRSYVNNGSVIDLQISRGKVEGLVSGSEIYKVKIDITVAARERWKAICADCAGSVGSIVELLQGKLSKYVMERVCREPDGLFPTPKEIKMSCSCPDSAGMCKHIAATLYGVGARLDHNPDVLFTLRGVQRSDLVSTGADLSITQAGAKSERVLVDDDVAALFGLEIETPTTAATQSAAAKAGMAIAAAGAPPQAKTPATKAADHRAPQPASKPVQKAELLKPKPGVPSKPVANAPAVARTKPAKARIPEPTRQHAAAARTVAPVDRKSEPGRAVVRKLQPSTVSPPTQQPAKAPTGQEKSPEVRTRAAKLIGAKARKPEKK